MIFVRALLFSYFLLSSYIVTAQPSEYVNDKECTQCHEKIAKDYQTLGMAHAFKPAIAKNLIANFQLPAFYHKASKTYYEMKLENEGLYFIRYHKDSKANKLAYFKRKVDWVMGSGNKSRSYLYQTENGEIFLFPIVWYSELEQFGMAPGYDNSNHQGITRQVRRECMFCHNAYPLENINDPQWAPHAFSKNLPSGLGCQRCHGPGKRHIEASKKDSADITDSWNTIINPSKLSAEKQNQVCDQCHLLPAVDFAGIRNPNKNTFSFIPGQDLNEYIYHVEITDELMPQKHRFEINHHAYRLRQSACFTKSEQNFYCLDCHDPHHKASKSERLSKTENTCKSCHELIQHKTNIAGKSCVSCHMQQKRTQDVVQVTMTDHKISLPESESKRLKQLDEVGPELSEIGYYAPADLDKNQQLVYQVVNIIKRIGPTKNRLIQLEQYLFTQKNAPLPLYTTLIEGLINIGEFDKAKIYLDKVYARFNNKALLNQWIGILNIRKGDHDEARRILLATIKKDNNLPEVHYNLGLSFYSTDNYIESIKHFQEAVELKENFILAKYYLAASYKNLERYSDALSVLESLIALSPKFDRTYLLMADIYDLKGLHEETVAVLNKGLLLANPNNKIKKRLSL